MKRELMDFLSGIKEERLICFGAGNYFERAYKELSCYGIEITACIDNNKALWGSSLHGIPVYSVEWLEEQELSNFIILIANADHYEEMAMQVKTFGVSEEQIYRYPLNGRFSNPEKKFWENRLKVSCRERYEYIHTKEEVDHKVAQMEKDNLFVIPRIPVMLTTRCTLRCEQCSNLMPYYERPRDYAASDVLGWIQAILDVVDEWICIELVGGEPFLYKELETVLQFVLTCEKIKHVEFTTNATIIPKENILSLLQNDKVSVHISDYGKIVSNQKFIDVMEEYRIKYVLYKEMKWVAVGGVEPRGRSEEEQRAQYWACPAAKMCKTVLNGKLYACSRAASLHQLGIEPKMEYIELVDNANLQEELKEFLLLNNSIACDYCDNAIEQLTFVEAAVQKKR